MKRWLLSVALLLAGVACIAHAQVPMTGAGKGAPGGGGGSYSGPGDITTFSVFWSLRAYSAAYATAQSALIVACTPSDASCATVNSTTSGNLNLAGSGLTCNNSTSICTIKTWKDQTVGGNCTGTCDLTQATIADRAVLVVPGAANGCSTTSNYCADFSGLSTTGYESAGASFFVYNNPYSFASFVFSPTSSAAGGIMNVQSGGTYAGLAMASGPIVGAYWGTNLNTGTLSSGSWYAIQALANTTSSTITANGSTSSGTVGTNSSNNGNAYIGWDQYNSKCLCKGSEFGWINNVNVSGTIQSNLTSNQRSYWGF